MDTFVLLAGRYADEASATADYEAVKDLYRRLGLDGDGPIRVGELLNWNQAFRLIAEIDDYFFGRDFHDPALEQFAFGGWRQVAIVLDQVFVIGILRRRGRLEVPFF